MKPQLLKINSTLAQCFSYRRDREPQQHNNWHYHEELELLYFQEGSGTQFIGDSISSFNAGDLVLVGSNLSHYWLFDQQEHAPDFQYISDVHVVHFKENFLGDYFLQLPENKPLIALFSAAKKGLQIMGTTKGEVVARLQKMASATGIMRITLLLESLALLASSPDYKLLSSLNSGLPQPSVNDVRMADIIDFITHHYRQQIKLAQLSERAGMTENSFCRYFKKHTGKTVVQFLTELRIGHACKLLVENELSIKQIYFETGFQNSVSFYKNFKQQMHMSPLAYQKSVLAKLKRTTLK